jgi:uracil-DNA glycosylase
MLLQKNMSIDIESSWKNILSHEFAQAYFDELTESVRGAYTDSVIYPAQNMIFNAFSLTPFDAVRVVILGQDPYHSAEQAHGLAFSVPDNVKIPPSLRNIYKEITADLGTTPPQSGNLERWAKQGVLLLNSTLTVRAGAAGSHQGLGWETFTDAVIKTISDKKTSVVFMLWGKYAQDKGVVIDSAKHLVLKAAHPSPLSAYNGFFGCKHFSRCNAYLREHKKREIAW